MKSIPGSLLSLGALFVLVGLAHPARATGPSSIGIQLRPIAVNSDGEVLLKTWRQANPEGAQKVTPVDLGWLLVTADGLWKEATHRLDVNSEEATAWFDDRLDWKRLPASLQTLLARHRFAAADTVRPDEGAGAVAWTGDHACVGSRCTLSTVVQRTVGGLPAKDAVNQPECRFYRAGVAILRNSIDGGGVQRGARFDHPGSALTDDTTLGVQEAGFDVEWVDAVALVQERALRTGRKE